jgi:hypothetical protein
MAVEYFFDNNNDKIYLTNSSGTNFALSVDVNGSIKLDSGSGPANPSTNGSFGITIDGGSNTITTGSKGYVQVPYSGTITGWNILSSQTGSIIIDVKKTTYANFPTTSSIAGTEKPTISSSNKNSDSNLTSWSTPISPGDIMEFVVESVSSIRKVTLSIDTKKS